MSEIIAEKLIDIESVKFSFENHFTLTSGLKSPVYVDCRKIISFINEYYSSGKKFVYESDTQENKEENFDDIERKIIKILETKIRPAVARDGGDIKFREFKNGKVSQVDKHCH